MSGMRLGIGIGVRWAGGVMLASLLLAGLLPCVMISATGQEVGTAIVPASLDRLAWLVGDWSGTMGRASIEEHWTAAAGKTMLGVGRVVAGDRTVEFEFLRIEQRPDAVVYIAQPGGGPPTEFRLTHTGATSVTFENPQHDHPKIIRYMKDADATLIAEIEGDEKGKHVKQRFTFTRIPRR